VIAENNTDPWNDQGTQDDVLIVFAASFSMERFSREKAEYTTAYDKEHPYSATL